MITPMVEKYLALAKSTAVHQESEAGCRPSSTEQIAEANGRLEKELHELDQARPGPAFHLDPMLLHRGELESAIACHEELRSPLFDTVWRQWTTSTAESLSGQGACIDRATAVALSEEVGCAHKVHAIVLTVRICRPSKLSKCTPLLQLHK